MEFSISRTEAIKIELKNYIPLTIFILLIILSYFIIRPFLIAIVFGALIAYIFHPFYRFVQKKLKNKTFSSLLVCLLILVLIILPSVYFTKILVQDSYTLYLLGKQKLSVGLFESCSNNFCNNLKALSEDPQIKYSFQEILKDSTNWVIKRGTELLTSLPSFLLNLFVMFFSLFYFLKDGETFLEKVSSYFTAHKKNYLKLVSRLKEIIHGLVYGYMLVAIIEGALGALGFFIFGVSSPIFWGIIMVILAITPFLGTGLVWVPASLILFLDGIFQNSPSLIYKGIGLFLYSLILVCGFTNLLRFKMIGDKTGIHPIVVLVGLFGGVLLIGASGIILGPLILSLAVVIIEMYLGRDKEGKEEFEDKI